MTTVAEAPLELREVRGPSALGTSRKRFWELLWLSAVTDFRMRYVDSVLGYFWALMRPLLTFGIIFLFLRQILNFGGKIDNFAPFLMINIILFQFFQETTNRGMRALASKEGLVRKMQFPRMVLPLSSAMTAAFTLVLNLIVGCLLLLAFGLYPQPSWLILPIGAAALVVLATGISLFLSVAFVRLPDVIQVWGVMSRVLFYGTPILFPIDLVPDSIRPIVMANPLTPIFITIQKAVTDPTGPTVIQAAGGLWHAMIPIVLGIAICVFSFWYFVREAPAAAEAL
ncbi:MAG: ABC transporter permease [Solirubrobacterales bacterium]